MDDMRKKIGGGGSRVIEEEDEEVNEENGDTVWYGRRNKVGAFQGYGVGG